MIVVDASVMALVFADPDEDPRVLAAHRALRQDPAWAVPEHWRTEVLSALRGLWRGGKIDATRADRAVAALAQVTVAVTPTGPHLRRMWELRSNLSMYDAAYVAVAEAHAVTLVTADARIARAGVARCPVQVVA
ncbi:type II toxin-antitoxin system VapC family toxin [Cellulomonas oligotrophica]|uniref:Ribonuclease VapC n=1 Tax=Cellulomonas oligotrophica TaxID=931536 RepID=A0A7Y9K063_9CELL|nr:type II toxin-antitoxin system VapC family toxin [Cellulomonas oligotrophica]NYD87529.1 putative nucleic acid-binding protein [Cellulomonas oligotrophica]GIG33407.1 ribonuclease VapC9 [Cellulomonas oligotrophica]